jgi:hypothetical protein
LALGGIGNKMKEWKNGMILSDVLKSVDLYLDQGTSYFITKASR